MKFAVLHHGNPVSESLWSGIPVNIVRTLQEMGHEVIPVGHLQPGSPLIFRVKAAIYKFLRKKIYLLNRDPAVFRLRAPDANRRLKELGEVDSVLITYPPDAAFLETVDPVFVLHDAAWADLINYYPGHESEVLAAETIAGGLWLDSKALARCDHAIYCSRWAASGIMRHAGISSEKVSVAPLGASFFEEPTRRDFEASLSRRGQGAMNLLFVGKEWFRKGGDIAVEIGMAIEQLGVPVQLHVVGCEPEGPVPSFVKCHGFLRKGIPEEGKNLAELFRTSDFFVMPTRAEALGMVYAESAAYGLPVLAADTGGVRDVARGEWSFVPDPGTSPQEYADWVVSNYRDRAAYSRLSYLARECYETQLNWPAFCTHLVDMVKLVQSAREHEAAASATAGKVLVKTPALST